MCQELSKVTAAGLLSQSIEKFLKLRIEGAGPLPKHHVLAHHYQRHGGRVRLEPVGDLPATTSTGSRFVTSMKSRS